MKKQQQLGMNPSTAANRLVKDTLWRLVETSGQNVCHRCGEPMSRDTFSIEHKTPWLDSEDPVGLYFDQDNIGFSHLRCNIKDSRKPVAECGSITKYNKYGCRCEPCKAAKRAQAAPHYTPEKRRERYERLGN